MRLRFTVRDIFWLTLVAALTTGWWIYMAATINERLLLKQQNDKMAADIAAFQKTQAQSSEQLAQATLNNTNAKTNTRKSP